MKVKMYFNSVLNLISKIDFIIPFLTRITVGSVFFQSGWGKLNHLDKTIAYFTSLNIPSAHLLAPLTSVFELISGILILLGFATRLAAIPLVVIMAIAIRTAKWEEVSEFTSLFQMSEFLYIVLLLSLIFYGAGKMSLDNILRKKL